MTSKYVDMFRHPETGALYLADKAYVDGTLGECGDHVRDNWPQQLERRPDNHTPLWDDQFYTFTEDGQKYYCWVNTDPGILEWQLVFEKA